MIKLAQVFKAFDNYNKKDPHVFTWGFLIRRNIFWR